MFSLPNRIDYLVQKVEEFPYPLLAPMKPLYAPRKGRKILAHVSVPFADYKRRIYLFDSSETRGVALDYFRAALRREDPKLLNVISEEALVDANVLRDFIRDVLICS